MELKYKLVILLLVILSFILGILTSTDVDIERAEDRLMNVEYSFNSQTIPLNINNNTTLGEICEMYSRHQNIARTILKHELVMICR